MLGANLHCSILMCDATYWHRGIGFNRLGSTTSCDCLCLPTFYSFLWQHCTAGLLCNLLRDSFFFFQETPVPGTYELRDFLQEKELDRIKATYNFKGEGRKKKPGILPDGAILLPGAYQHKDFLEDLTEQQLTYQFKNSGRKRVLPGIKDPDCNVSPCEYETNRPAVKKMPVSWVLLACNCSASNVLREHTLYRGEMNCSSSNMINQGMPYQGSVMQTVLQKIGEHFENMPSMSGRLRPRDPPLPSYKIVYIINDANVVEKNCQPITEIVWQRLKLTRPP